MNEFPELKNYLLSQNRSKHTINSYLSDVSLFKRWYEHTNKETLSPEGLLPEDIYHYIHHLKEVKKAAPSTINRRLAALRAYTAWALETGLTDRDPLSGIKNLEDQKSPPRVLGPEEQDSLITQVEEQLSEAHTEAAKRQAFRDRAIVYVLMHTGLRVSELCALELSDIEINNGQVKLCIQPNRQGQPRQLPINRDTRQALKDWLKARPRVNTQAVFVGKHGEAASPLLVQRLLAKLGRKASLDVTPFTLRHTFAKNLIDQEVSLKKVAMLLGHSSLNTIMAYTSSEQVDMAWAVEALVN